MKKLTGSESILMKKMTGKSHVTSQPKITEFDIWHEYFDVLNDIVDANKKLTRQETIKSRKSKTDNVDLSPLL